MATTSSSISPGPPHLGLLLRMRALSPSALPPHPDLAPQQSSRPPPQLQTFLASVLAEAETFMTSYLPRTFKTKSTSKTSTPATAYVELHSHELSASDLPKDVRNSGTAGETWFARTSLHENKAAEGTASWEEFDDGLRRDHSMHEMEYTPDVKDAHKVLDWETQLDEVEHMVEGGWEDVQAEIREMCHHIPTPLKDRVFPVFVVTAKRRDSNFLVVQIPVNTKGMRGAKYPSKGKVTAGMYVSVERVELVEDRKKVKWQMATASDAKGNLPMWAQKMGVPGAVVKDVGLFIGWTSKGRQGQA